MHGATFLMVTLTLTSHLHTAAPLHTGVMVVDSWNDRYCRASLCSLMSARRWTSCCHYYSQCCAYVDHAQPKGPFYYEEMGVTDLLHVTPPSRPQTSPHQPPATPPRPSPPVTPQPSPDSQQPPRFDRLMARPTPQYQSDQPHPRPQQHHSYSRILSQPSVNSQPPRSFNDVQDRENKKQCRPRFCSLLTISKQTLCCHVYQQCCAYVNLYRYTDPFYFEKDQPVE